MERIYGEHGKKFGFGCMRLPLLDENDPTSFDYAKIEALFDLFLERGFTYFDTAYTYHGYHGEEAVREALVKRHPRDSFQLATKLPLRDFSDAADMERIFEEQREHCGVTYFDFYLLHNMGTNVYEKCRKYDAFGFVRRLKAEGKVKHVGMSFHDTPELLDKILAEYADGIDFLQLQINYADMEQPSVQARRCLEIAEKYGKPVSVMEPCKGGTLIRLPDEAAAVLREENPDAPIASWALRFAASQKNVFMVLSGMNSEQQVLENTAAFSPFVPMTAAEEAACAKAAEILEQNTAIPCTACAYCTHDCPRHIAIPQYFALYNNVKRVTGSFSSQQVYYNNTALANGKASDCIHCRRCEKACPQHLPVVEFLEAVAETFEKNARPLAAKK